MTTTRLIAHLSRDEIRRLTPTRRELDRAMGWWRDLDPVRQDVIVEMAITLGVAGLLAFRHTLEAAHCGAFAHAADRMLTSRWASEAGERARRLAAMMRSGAREKDTA